MSIIEAIILGIIQGLTEFIPVSSSGHLVVMHELLGVTSGGLSFDVALHIGTVLALFVYFRQDIKNLIGGLLGRNQYKRLAWLIALAAIPAVIGGVLLQDRAETTFRSLQLVAFNLAAVGVLMLIAEYFSKRLYTQPTAKAESITLKQAVVVGFAQTLALIPGVSRSGSTITAGLFVGVERVAATRFSFLLAIPITVGAIIKVLADGASMDQVANSPAVFMAGITAALFSGLFAIRFLLAFLSRHSLATFAYYRIGFAIVLLIYIGAH
ncbi:undecaprenyl-diphosphate phosphatase [soil metagenome]